MGRRNNMEKKMKHWCMLFQS